MYNQCWISRALRNPRNKGIDNVARYNKRKLIARIVLAWISGRPCRNSHICYYVRDRWDKYLLWSLLLLPENLFRRGKSVASIFLERSQSIGQTNFIKTMLPDELIPLCFSFLKACPLSFNYLRISTISAKLEKVKTQAKKQRIYNIKLKFS